MPSLTLDGQTFYYETHGNPLRPPIFLMHGYLQIGRDLALVAHALAASGYYVVTPDVAGYGRSTPPMRTFPMDFYQRDARLMLALVHALNFAIPPHLMGFSDGGEIALLMGILAAQACRSVTAWGACGHYSEALGEWVRHAPPSPITPSQRARHPHQQVDTWYAAWRQTFLQIVANGGDVSLSRAKDLAVPLLMLVGTDDPLNPSAAVQHYVEAATHPACTPKHLRIFEKAGHFIHEEQPDAFLAEVTAFLARLPTRFA